VPFPEAQYSYLHFDLVWLSFLHQEFVIPVAPAPKISKKYAVLERTPDSFHFVEKRAPLSF
jgi:hypothetical protein